MALLSLTEDFNGTRGDSVCTCGSAAAPVNCAMKRDTTGPGGDEPGGTIALAALVVSVKPLVLLLLESERVRANALGSPRGVEEGCEVDVCEVAVGVVALLVVAELAELTEDEEELVEWLEEVLMAVELRAMLVLLDELEADACVSGECEDVEAAWPLELDLASTEALVLRCKEAACLWERGCSDISMLGLA